MIYNDEDNNPMFEDPFDGIHNPTIYSSRAEMKAYESALADGNKKHDGCWNCMEYDGNRCMKCWNNAEPEYYQPDRDDKEPDDLCEDHKTDENAVWEDYFDDAK